MNIAHKTLFRMSMSDLCISREFFQRNLPAEICRSVDLSSLELLPRAFIEQPCAEPTMDCLFKADWVDKEECLYFIVELLGEPDARISLRMLRYTCDVIDQHLKNSPQAILPFVFPMVVYYGEDEFALTADIPERIRNRMH